MPQGRFGARESGWTRERGKFVVRSVQTQAGALKKILEMIAKGSIDPVVRRTAIQITADCEARDDLAELRAIFDAVKHGTDRIPGLLNGLRYIADPTAVDFYTGARRTLIECMNGACAGDCLPLDTLVVGRGYKLLPIGDVAIGDVIMGDGSWTRVTNKWDKGIQPLLGFRLSNGGFLRCTPDHKLFRMPRGKQPGRDRSSAIEVAAKSVQVTDLLLTPETLPVGSESIDPEKAWLLGAYIADGWSDPAESNRRVFLSGLDGKRKEAQKARAKAWCDANGIATRWHRKYIAMNDAELAKWLSAAGHRALEKHVPTLDLDAQTVDRLLEGLSADAAVRDGVFGTISKELAIQLRILLRMQGRSSSIVRVDDHGGFGSNPIYRVTPRLHESDVSGKKILRYAKVRAIEALSPEPTVDIETESHRFYLPETDLVVHNCDDHTILVGSLCASIGFRVGARAWGPDPSEDVFTHVYCIVAVPKRGPWPAGYLGHGMDTTVPRSSVGWEPPKRRALSMWLED